MIQAKVQTLLFRIRAWDNTGFDLASYVYFLSFFVVFYFFAFIFFFFMEEIVLRQEEVEQQWFCRPFFSFRPRFI